MILWEGFWRISEFKARAVLTETVRNVTITSHLSLKTPNTRSNRPTEPQNQQIRWIYSTSLIEINIFKLYSQSWWEFLASGRWHGIRWSGWKKYMKDVVFVIVWQYVSCKLVRTCRIFIIAIVFTFYFHNVVFWF